MVPPYWMIQNVRLQIVTFHEMAPEKCYKHKSTYKICNYLYNTSHKFSHIEDLYMADGQNVDFLLLTISLNI